MTRASARAPHFVPSSFLASVVVAGPPDDLARFRETVRHLMVRDIDAETYTEHHAEGRLEFRFTPKKGIPFPAFAQASGEFPELRIEASWENGPRALRGRAILQGGKLIEQDSEPLSGPREAAASAAQIDLSLTAGGDLQLALICLPSAAGEWVGYAASAQRHVYFSFSRGNLHHEDAEVAAPDPALESLALEFAQEWLWFDESAAQASAVERARYAERGRRVRGANVRAVHLDRLPVSTLEPQAQALRAALLDALRTDLESDLRTALQTTGPKSPAPT